MTYDAAAADETHPRKIDRIAWGAAETADHVGRHHRAVDLQRAPRARDRERDRSAAHVKAPAESSSVPPAIVAPLIVPPDTTFSLPSPETVVLEAVPPELTFIEPSTVVPLATAPPLYIGSSTSRMVPLLTV